MLASRRSCVLENPGSFGGFNLARHGGNQGGRPKGTSGIEKEALRARLRAKVAEHIDPMTDAQIANSKGIKYLVVRQKSTGRFLRRIEDPKEMDKALQSDMEYLEVWAKDPSVQAFTDLMNRTIDKPAEQEQVLNHTGVLEIRWKGGE